MTKTDTNYTNLHEFIQIGTEKQGLSMPPNIPHKLDLRQLSPVERRASSLYNRPEGQYIARGKAPGKWNNITSPEGANL